MLPPDPGIDVQAISDQLRRTQPWVRFLAIFGFVSAGLMILGGLFAGAAGAFAAASGQAGGVELVTLLFIYPLMGVLYIYPSLCLLRYANSIRQFVGAPVAQHLESALDAQRAFWKFAAILAAISIVAMFVMIVLAIVVGVAAGVMGQPI